jgi:pimeloyl-ACP methyl ester carboxylesterase
MTDDVVALLDRLNIQKADIVGWSDGAIIGLDMAMRHPDRVGRIFAFGANTQTSGLKDGFDKNPVFAAYMMRARQEYAHLSPTPDQYDAFQEQIGKMWEDQPNWTDAQLRTIRSPVLVVDGDHDEGIKREHTNISPQQFRAPAADPAQCQPFCLLAGSRPVQCCVAGFPRRQVT